MQLAPGPIPTVSVDFSGFTSSTPGNVAFVEAADGDLQDALDAMDTALDVTQTFPPSIIPDTIDGDLGTLDTNVGALSAFDTGADTAAGEVQIQDLSEKMSVAYATTPGEAFEPLPGQYSTNPLFPGLPPPSISSAVLNNLTRPGDTTFYPGDQYEIDVSLLPTVGGAGAYAGVDVTLYKIQDGTALDAVDLCNTDQNGFLKAVGTFQVADVGDWTVTLAYTILAGGGINGGPVAADNTTFTFTVSPLPAGAAAPAGSSQIVGGGLHPVQTLGAPCDSGVAIGAQLLNLTRQSQQFFDGDQWQLTITGPPDNDVLISALFNSAPLPWVVIGTTDASGQVVLTGTMTGEYVGTWVENFQVGSQVWSGNLAFSVSPAAPRTKTIKPA